MSREFDATKDEYMGSRGQGGSSNGANERSFGLVAAFRTGEYTFSKQALRHTLAFPENSLEVVADAIGQVTLFMEQGAKMFVPTFPLSTEVFEARGVNRYQTRDSEGVLSPAEAAASVVLQTEAAAVTQAYERDDQETIRRLHQVFENTSGEWLTDAIEGFTCLGGLIAYAARGRELILQGRKADDDEYMHSRRLLHDGQIIAEVEDDLRKDGMVIAAHTIGEIVQRSENSMDKWIRGIHQGPRSEEIFAWRVDNRNRGLRIAANLYLEALDYSSRFVPRRVDSQSVVPIPKEIGT